MPAPRLSDEKLDEALRLVAEHGNVGLAAKASDMSYTTLETRYKKALARDAIDPAIQVAMEAVNTGLRPKVVWTKTGKNGSIAHSVMLGVDKTQDFLDRMAVAFENIKPIEPIAAPAQIIETLLATYKMFDWHLGQHSWGKETGGQDYDLALADSDIRRAINSIMEATPSAAQAILVFGGDNLHVDDNRAETPAHKHKLDADGRYQKIIDTGVDAIAYMCESLLAKHGQVTCVILRGNHDPHSHIALRTGLRQRYLNNPRITIWAEPFDIFWFQFGNVGFFANHGDRSKPETLTLEISDKCPWYSQVRHRYLYTGHRHRESVQQLPGMLHEGLGPIAPADAYGARFSGRRTMYSTTFDLRKGRKARAYDSLDRNEDAA